MHVVITLTALWATRQTENTKEDRELHVKTTLRELIVYIVFLVILCVGTYSTASVSLKYNGICHLGISPFSTWTVIMNISHMGWILAKFWSRMRHVPSAPPSSLIFLFLHYSCLFWGFLLICPSFPTTRVSCALLLNLQKNEHLLVYFLSELFCLYRFFYAAPKFNNNFISEPWS